MRKNRPSSAMRTNSSNEGGRLVGRRVAWDKGPSIKYVTLFLDNFYPPTPVTLRHTFRDPPKVRHTSRTPPIFRRPSPKTPDKSPLVQFLSQLCAVFLSGGFVRGSFVWKVLSGVVFVRSCSVGIHLLHQKVKHHFKFHVSYV